MKGVVWVCVGTSFFVLGGGVGGGKRDRHEISMGSSTESKRCGCEAGRKKNGYGRKSGKEVKRVYDSLGIEKERHRHRLEDGQEVELCWGWSWARRSGVEWSGTDGGQTYPPSW